MNPDTKRFYPTDDERSALDVLQQPKIDAVRVQPDWTRFALNERLNVTRVRHGTLPVVRELVIKAITQEVLLCKPGIDFATGTKVEIKGEVFCIDRKGRNTTALRPLGQKPA